MNAQKLGVILSVNMAIACVMMQGCKAVKSGARSPEPVNPPVVTEPLPAPVAPVPVVVSPAPAAPVAPVVVAPVVPVVDVKPLPVEPAPEVKPLPVVTPVAAAPVVKPSVYIVKKGDTLSEICQSKNVRMKAVLAANPGLNPNRIRIGQKLNIPVAGANAAEVKTIAAVKPVETKPVKKVASAPAPSPLAANTNPPTKTKTTFKVYAGATKEYVVKNGDSYGKIAYENGISSRALKEMNNATSDNLRVGQKIKIPATKPVAAKASAKTTDKVKAQASAAVAKDKVEKPVQAPVAAPVAVKPADGAEAPVTTPAVAPDAAVTPEVKTDVAPATSGPVHKVQEGDDLVSVAISWGISPSQLMDLNKLNADDKLVPGQVLKLPENAKPALQ